MTTNILKKLRVLVPQRPLGFYEAERIVELQANRFRELLGISEPRLPDEAITALPRVTVAYEKDMPVSGLTFWDNGQWHIKVNASEPYGRMRFSMCHEFGHAVFHANKQSLFPDSAWRSSEEKSEALADLFAGMLLMPKKHVKRLFGERRTPGQMAHIFGVTPRAISVRLAQLGLSEPVPRCAWMPTRRPRGTYHRAFSVNVGVAP